MEAIFTSTLLVALAEIGDKTQLLALVLAARFRKPVPVVLGILVATLANHALAALVGVQAAAWLEGEWFRYLVAISFIAMGLWTLIPDKLDEDEGELKSSHGAFLTTLVAFFLVEMGDKTQIATIALGAQFQSIVLVTIGTTAGMMLANAPVVWFGDTLVRKLSLTLIHRFTAVLFIAIGLWIAAQTWGLLGG